VPGQKLGQVLFVNGHAPFAEHLYLGFVVVNAGNLVAHIRKADSRNEPYVTGPDDTDGNWL
jgi:hypothetical protein